MTTYGSTPQINRTGETPGPKALFHSVRDIALILDKSVKAGYGVLKAGTLMSECSITRKLYPYPMAAASSDDTNAKAYCVQAPGDGAAFIYTNIEDSYKFNIADELIIDGGTAGTKEVQSMANTTPAEDDVYTLTYAGVTLTSTALTASVATANLLAALIAGTGYADLPYVLTAGSSAITITFKTVGDKDAVVAAKTVGSGTPAVSTTTPGVAADATTSAAENLGAITAIDRTAVNGTQAKITFTTVITTFGNFTAVLFGGVYVKSYDEDSTPFAGAKYVLDADIDTGTGVNAKGALCSVVISNAVLYESVIVGLDSAAKTDLGSTDDGRFLILK
jgi:hypothetical protein